MTPGPAIFGYAVVDADLVETNPQAADDQVQSRRREFAQFAVQHGYTLAGVFVDARGRAEDFYTLVNRIRTEHITLVVVPNPTHFQHLACLTGADIRAVSRYLHARILTLPTATDQ